MPTDMHLTDAVPALIAALSAAAALGALVRVAPRWNWVDGGSEPRKRNVAPLPLVGGAAILIGLLAGWSWIALVGRESFAFVPGRALRELTVDALGPWAEVWPLGGLIVAFALGTTDDLLADGLRPVQKLCGQLTAGAVVGVPLVLAQPGDPGAWGALLLLALGAAIALNALNTFDNSDGAAAGLCTVALCAPAPMFAAAVAAFLPWNIGRRGAWPRAILGDAGSHLLGMAVLLTPAAWPALALPLADLARLSWIRLRSGAWPWEGDRRHLAHRLELRWGRSWQVPASLAALVLPTAVLGWNGALATLPLMALLLRAAPDVHGAESAQSTLPS
jgi:UDP-N-acetylmuramyl pentapeptide phosphotransferase/UDP-N-acetylglucosamine-1-phosphate transferase